MHILIIEDDKIWQSKIEFMLNFHQYYDISICNNLSSTREFLLQRKTDLIIADIILEDQFIFTLIEEGTIASIPIIFITSSEDLKYYQLSKNKLFSSYLIKPFHAISLIAAIENHAELNNINKITKPQKFITVRGVYNEKIELVSSQIVLIKSDWNYCHIKTLKNQFALKSSLYKLQQNLGNEIIQIHRTYLVNKKHIGKVNFKTMELFTPLGNLPIGRLYKQNVIDYIIETKNI